MEKQKFEELKNKIEAARKSGKFDLSTDEDLSLAVMNLISLEEHFFFTGEKTGKPEYFDLLGEVREMRKELLAKLTPEHEGETWCVSKHLLATAMRLMEVGTKLHSDGRREEAKAMFDRSYRIYSLFWGLRLDLVDLKDLKKGNPVEKSWGVEDIVSKLVNCCDE